MNFYERNITEIERRILEIFRKSPELINISDISCLYDVVEFDVSDIQPSYIQVVVAFNGAKEKVKK